MRRILLAAMSTVAAVVMLFGYRTSTPEPIVSAPTTIAAGSSAGTSSGTATTPPAPTSGSPSGDLSGSPSGDSSSSGSSPSSAASRTVVGDTAQTQWGPVQVQLTVAGGQVTAVDLLRVPSGNGRDVQINTYAVPILVAETLQAQSANIDSVSGATVTSHGYLSSLQSALDAAGL